MKQRKRPASTSLPPPDTHITRLVFQPCTNTALQNGINTMVNAIRPTLGPQARFVAIDPVSRGNVKPELLDNAGLLARRIIELPDPNEDMGAMLCRKAIWDQYDQVGDGAATTAVLLQSVYNQGLTYIMAGGDAMRLSYYLEKGMHIIRRRLLENVLPLEGREQIAWLAESVSSDAPLAEALGDIFDVIGEHGRLDIRSSQRRDVEKSFVEGVYYKGGVFSNVMINDPITRKVQLENAALLVSDLDIQSPNQVISLVNRVHAAQGKRLVVVGKDLSEQAGAVLMSVSRDAEKFHAIGVKAPGALTSQETLLEDLALLTGARLFLTAVGDSLNNVKLEDLGHARRVWADQAFFGIVGGQGSPVQLKKRAADLRLAYENAETSEDRQAIQDRIGRLMGGSATLRVGGNTETELEVRKQRAERTSRILRGALMKGILPGGGVALLACRTTLCELAAQTDNLDERTAYRILSRMVEAPTRTILSNAGYDPAECLPDLEAAASGCGFDVRVGHLVNMLEAGIVDSAEVLLGAVTRAISGAALALTVEVLVHHKKPEIAVLP